MKKYTQALKYHGSNVLNSAKKHKNVLMALGGVASLAAAGPALASTSQDIFASQGATVKASFGHGSSVEKWFYIGETLIALFVYSKQRSPLVFAGLFMMFLFTRIVAALIG
ncbi:F-pilin [Serratia ficaria]|uniref:type IV conjugative transfer system pilin TraA n=1 Tax=Serratia ficaria TaxID=61651 RepID=UPI002183FA03|nr:type IV conjugative transfer system pilin TraA [Serratia ficaria]CAI2533786.1 F-pilin [Serratia ficaria]